MALFLLTAGFFAATAQSTSSAPARHQTGSECEAHIAATAAKTEVPVGVLYAVGLTESGQASNMSPLALNIGGKSVLAKDNAEAVMLIEQAVKSGDTMVDIGCMQINYRYHAENFGSIEEMLDPQRNVKYGAEFLMKLQFQHGNWTKAVAHYHASARNPVAQRRYVCRVIKHLVHANFGRWTPEAKAYCASA
jgi:hypothetical protein